MKKLIPLLALILLSCEEEKFTGYIVFKQHAPKHMCCSNPKTTTEASVIVVPAPMQHTHQHEEQEPTWKLFVSNSQGTRKVNVTASCYKSFHVTDKVKIYGNSVELIKKGCKDGNN